MSNKLHQTVAEKIINEVHQLLSDSIHTSLAVFNPDGQYPSVSRVSMAIANNSNPVILTSALSPHTKALKENANCSLLIGNIADGDPMAQSRITLFCRAFAVEDNDREKTRADFLERNPKAINYIDLPDFAFWNLRVERATYIAGFGRAYHISGQQLFG
ncbi:MAG: pyridoxamine 5'-phosphate oxidase family protein [Devosiaceae bacterium]|nr:pyridoxamine 5'-phosphate oxidase family protein [Devosiaceae bacterium]